MQLYVCVIVLLLLRLLLLLHRSLREQSGSGGNCCGDSEVALITVFNSLASLWGVPTSRAIFFYAELFFNIFKKTPKAVDDEGFTGNSLREKNVRKRLDRRRCRERFSRKNSFIKRIFLLISLRACFFFKYLKVFNPV